VRLTYPDGTFDENQWGCCTIERRSDRAGRATTFIHDALNRLIVQRDPKGQLTVFQYDAEGKLVKLLDGKGNQTQWQYDARYRPAKKLYADGSAYSYTYDNVGNLAAQLDAKGGTVSSVTGGVVDNTDPPNPVVRTDVAAGVPELVVEVRGANYFLNADVSATTGLN